MKRRVLTLALAVLLAVLGTAGVLAYVRGADNRAVEGQHATTVLIAIKPIPAGTSAGAALKAGLLGRQLLPMSAVPSDAVHAISPGMASLVTSSEVPQGELLLSPVLVPASQLAPTGSLAVPPGKFVVAIQLCVPEAVAGYVRAGSWVAVFDTVNNTGPVSGQSGCNLPQQQQLGAHTKLLIPRVQVLSVGQAPAAQPSGSGKPAVAQPAAGSSSSSAILVSFAVGELDAQQLILLNETGVPYLALLSSSTQAGIATSAPASLKH